jgi:hypothetical protein
VACFLLELGFVGKTQEELVENIAVCEKTNYEECFA